jgi:hypothetical protein
VWKKIILIAIFMFVYFSSWLPNFLTIFLGRFTKERVLLEGLFWKDIEKLIDDYNSARKKKINWYLVSQPRWGRASDGSSVTMKV